MAVAIRLRREGAKNHPYYTIVVADQRSPRDGSDVNRWSSAAPQRPGARGVR